MNSDRLRKTNFCMIEKQMKRQSTNWKIFASNRMKHYKYLSAFTKQQKNEPFRSRKSHMDEHTTLQMSKHTDVQCHQQGSPHTKKLPGSKREAKVFSVKPPRLRKSGDSKVYLKTEEAIYKTPPMLQFSNMNLDVRSLTKAIHVQKYIHVSQRNTIRYDKV